MKFFKSFQANPRLQVVTNTMVKAASDICHFGVVFSAVFMTFVITGHIFFGNDIKEFRGISASLDTCFLVLMGQFGWYEAASDSDLGLSSGMPHFMLSMWFWLYMVFVLVILLNMLLAIILDHYCELTNLIKLDYHVPALWGQTAAYFHHTKKTKGHIPQKHLAVLLEDDDTPCHVAETVTTGSLLEAFPKMQPDQAEHLMEWLKVEVKKLQHDAEDVNIGRLKMLEKHMESASASLAMVKLNGAVNVSMLRGDDGPFTPEQAARALSSVSDQLGEHIQRLELRMGNAALNLTRRMENVAREIGYQSHAVEQRALAPPQWEEAIPAMGTQPLSEALCDCKVEERSGSRINKIYLDESDEAASKHT